MMKSKKFIGDEGIQARDLSVCCLIPLLLIIYWKSILIIKINKKHSIVNELLENITLEIKT